MTLTLTERIDTPPAARALRLVAGTQVAAPQLRLVPPLPARRPAHRDPRPAAENFARGVAEVMARARPVDQLRNIATFDVVRIVERAATRQPDHRAQSRLRPRLRSVHVAAVGDGVIEACAVIDGGVRSRALAFRLESNGRAWRATVVQLG